ncbi:MAG: permease [Pseudomonadota bacterium]
MTHSADPCTPDRAPWAATARAVLDLPIVVWMVAAALALGLAGGLGADDLVDTFNAGFGRALGEFALILLPSFVLAACLSRAGIASAGAGRMAAFASPFAGAGMICPDTAYAALSPAAGRRKLDVAFGAYAGFKLLYPAGPLIVATGLGVMGTDGLGVELALMGAALTLPVWAAGVIWGRIGAARGAERGADGSGEVAVSRGAVLAAFAPFGVLASLLLIGGVVGRTGFGALDFLLMPKGALLAAALLALAQTAPAERRACWDSAVRRTGGLLLVIGAASAFGAILTTLVPLADIVPPGSGIATLFGLFALTVAFKLVQGSSMATFAAVAPVAAPVVTASGAHPAAAVFAICLGSFIAILPNDSYYWLVRRDALDDEPSDLRAIRLLTGGAVAQAGVGMALVIAAVVLWG